MGSESNMRTNESLRTCAWVASSNLANEEVFLMARSVILSAGFAIAWNRAIDKCRFTVNWRVVLSHAWQAMA